MLHQLQGGQTVHSNSVLRKEEPNYWLGQNFVGIFPSYLNELSGQPNICPQHLISVPHTSQMGYQVHVSQISSLTKQSPFLWLPGSSSLFSSGFKISHLIFTSTSILDSLPVLLLTFHPRHVGQSDCPGVSIHLGHPLPDIKLGATGNTFPVIQPRSIERKIKDMCLFVSRKRLFRLLLKL